MKANPTEPGTRPDAAARETLATDLVTAYRTRTLMPAPSRTLAGFALADALDVAGRVRRLRVAGGDRVAGYKVGFTNGAVRAQFDAPAPLAAPVYEQTMRGVTDIVAGELLGPRIEPEVVLGIGSEGEVAWAAFAFEIVQSHVAAWEFAYLDAIVDFGLHAALVIGEQRLLGPGDAERLAGIDVELRRDDTVVERGHGSAVDGGPLGSLTWLRGDLDRAGYRLEPGDVVSTGSLTRVPSIAVGERWTIAALGDDLPPLSIAVR